MKAFSGLLSVCLIALCSACTTAPVRFYTLNAVDSLSPAGSAHCGYFDLQPVGLPAYLDQPQMVIHGTNGRVSFLEADRWSSPLGDEIYALIASQLSSTLGMENIHGLATPTNGQITRIRLQLQQLRNQIDQQVELQASWSLATDKHSAVYHATLREPAAGGMDGLPAACSAHRPTTLASTAASGMESCNKQGNDQS